MKSVAAKILAWTVGTIAISLVAFAAISIHLPPGEFFRGAIAMVEGEAAQAHEEGGPAKLAEYLARLDRYFPAEHHLTDPSGRDLVDGVDRSGLVALAGGSTRPFRLPGGGAAMVGDVRRGRYRLIVVLPERLDPLGILPYFSAVVLAIALLGYAFAIHLASPLRTLRQAVDRLGAGDLSARVQSRRKDEIGELSRSFDSMADQIQTLRAAELRLLQDVSHELRSPLARLGFNLELARSAPDGDRIEPFARIEKDLGRLSRLVAEVLELTCVEGDPGSSRREEVRLVELVRSVVDDCVPEAGAKGCPLLFRPEGEAVLVGDPELIRRGVENVLRNAIRHSPEGSPIEVGLHPFAVAGRATIDVRDRGPGVPGDLLSTIFDPFVRADDDRSRSGGGVGLGLSIARRAIELHGGRIDARNAEPGLIVTIELPASVSSPS